MESKELRLENWVLLDWENIYKKVNATTLTYIIRSEMIGKNHPFKPIPLTEEILLKSGFKKVDKLHYDNDYNNIFNFESCYISLDNYTNVFFDWVDDSVRCYETCYLHQLQNLYFALTNKELEVNL